jgi:hypothetical protein
VAAIFSNALSKVFAKVHTPVFVLSCIYTLLATALNKLPDLSPTHRQIAAATGTYDQKAQFRLSPDLSVRGAFGKSPSDSGGANCSLIAQARTPDKSANYRDLQGFLLSEGDGARTRNHRIDSPVL